MKISFLVNHVHNGWGPTDKRLGGTEESVVRWSEELVRRGNQVIVYRNGDKDGFHNGVLYVDRNRYSGGSDICINVKSSEVAPKEPTLYLTNETDADDKDLSEYLGVIWPSQWADDNIPVNNQNRFILPHGYDPSKIYPKEKVNKRCLYASSPDRGLETLSIIWPSIVAEHPDADLYVTYNGIIDADNVKYGEFSEEEMNDLFNTSDLWIHPCNGGELFGMSAIKAQAAQAIPVYFPTMALRETVQSGISCEDGRDMYNSIVQLLGDQAAKDKLREEMKHLKLPTWESTTSRLLEIINSVVQ